MKKVIVEISNVDDGATVYLNGSEIMHVNYMHNRSTDFTARDGDLLSLVIHNMTGGAWHATMRVTVDGKEHFKQTWNGSSGPFQNEAMRFDLPL